MIIPWLSKLYGIILEKNINGWLEMKGKQDKGQTSFRRNRSTTDHPLTLRIVAEECRNKNLAYLVCLWILENILIQCLEITCGIG